MVAEPKLEPFLWILTHYFPLVNLAWLSPTLLSVDLLLTPHRGKPPTSGSRIATENPSRLWEPTCPPNLNGHLFPSFVHPFSSLVFSAKVQAFCPTPSGHLHLLSPGLLGLSLSETELTALFLCWCWTSVQALDQSPGIPLECSPNPSNHLALPIHCPKYIGNPLPFPHLRCHFCGRATRLSHLCYTHLPTFLPASAFSLLIQSPSLHQNKLLKTQI